jgi:hypothetical protein
MSNITQDSEEEIKEEKPCPHHSITVWILTMHKQTFEYDSVKGELEMTDDNIKETHWDSANYECHDCGTNLSQKEFMALYCRDCRELDKASESS